MTMIDEDTRIKLEAEAFRKLVEHLQTHPEVQNIDLMNLSGFCRNCLAKWYLSGAEKLAIPMSYDQAREAIYGMPYEQWKALYQTEASAEQLQGLASRVKVDSSAEQ